MTSLNYKHEKDFDSLRQGSAGVGASQIFYDNRFHAQSDMSFEYELDE